MNIHQTTNYDQFKFLEGNRQVNKAHLAHIRKSVELHGPLSAILIVNDKMEIIDGQHRFCVLKEMNLPITYVTKRGYGLKEVHIYNQNAKNWTMEQFMNSYADMGLKEYEVYKFFKNKYSFGHMETLTMLNGRHKNSVNNGRVDVFKAGKFKVKDLAGACNVAEKIYDFAPYYEGFRRRSFVWAMCHITRDIAEYNHEKMMTKVSFQSAKLQDQANVKDYLRILEGIYNFKSRDDYARFDIH